MKTAAPRVMIAGTGSGCGKTTAVCAVLQALVNRGMNTGAFKCGPDYIDPMFHSEIIGAESRNLDLFLFDTNTVKLLMAENSRGRDISIIEGVMGFYDGQGISSTDASSYELAAKTQSPVVLVVDAKGASLSVLAVIKGFLEFNEDNTVCGVILNRCSDMVYRTISEAGGKYFGGRIRFYGYLPPMPDCSLESRHLGLVTAAEVDNLREKLNRLSAQAEKSIDIDGLIALANSAPELSYEPIELPKLNEPIRIAAARDKAFCFYYADSLELLRRLGAELVEFSPLTDEKLPENIHGIYLGGGYPELYARELSENASMRASLHSALSRGVPCVAECGGFMYLNKSIGEWPQVGFLSGDCFDTGRLTRFGYVTLTAKEDNLLCKAGDSIPGHEFHHWDSSENGRSFSASKSSGRSWDCVVSTPKLYAGFPHFHFYSNPGFAVNFCKACLEEKNRHD